ncbi:MAG: OmpA family protein [Planctomycetota bacterium]|nr:OmpA family protein [Phycisphaerales bacterium]
MPMCSSLSTHLSRLVLVALLLGTGLISVGCANNEPRMDDPLVMEAQELRRLNESLELALRDAEDRYRALDEQNRDLADQLAAQPDFSDTGFEGLGAGVSRRPGEVVVEIAGEVLFDSGSVVIKRNAQQTLDTVVRVINQRYSGNEIRVAGFTDSDPIRRSDWKTNERLSAERAMAVESYLVSKGVDNNRIHSAAFGPAKPKGSKRESRRVEIIILE